MNAFHANRIVENIVIHFQSEKEISELLAYLSTVDWKQSVEVRLNEESERPCGVCREWKDQRQFTFISSKNGSGDSGLMACPDCLKITAAQTYLCHYCGTPYSALYVPQDNDVCSICTSARTLVYAQNTRTRKLGLSATLTVKQYGETVQTFERKCAYCSGAYECFEHYLPVSLGGGTTQGNCLPSCHRCNLRKKNKYPDDFAPLFPAENMAKIQDYLANMA